MKVVILAGGKGTRISEESIWKPKPMVEIGGKPILWHIMKWYASFGFQEFIICCGYKGHIIKEFFLHYNEYTSDHTVHLKDMSTELLTNHTEPWKVTLADTGLETLTAGRILKIQEYVGNEPFMLTYGDGVANVNIQELLEFHKQSKSIVTITTIRPEGRFGAIKIEEESGKIQHFKEKARKDQSWINMGFMVMEPSVFTYLGDGSTMLETTPFEQMATDGVMSAYKHTGFWSPMDTVHDREYLEKIWQTGNAPWRTQ